MKTNSTVTFSFAGAVVWTISFKGECAVLRLGKALGYDLEGGPPPIPLKRPNWVEFLLHQRVPNKAE